MNDIKNKKKLIISAVSVGILLCGVAGGLFAKTKAESKVENFVKEREVLVAALPGKDEIPDTDGFRLNILCETCAVDSFHADEEGSSVLAKQNYKRDMHLMSETGIAISKTETSDFYKTAVQNVLSGDYNCNLFAADVKELAALVVGGYLENVSYLRRFWDCEQIDAETMQKLAFAGKQYMISSDALDIRYSAGAMFYNKSLVNQLVKGGSEALEAKALGGELTVEYLLTLAKDAIALYNEENLSQTENSAGAGAAEISGICTSAADGYILYNSLGARIVDSETLKLCDLDSFTETLLRIGSLLGSGAVGSKTDFEKMSALFSVEKLSDYPDLGEGIYNIGFLPLPKADRASDYCCTVDLGCGPALAIPANESGIGKVEYLVCRMAFLSSGYIKPSVRASYTANGQSTEMLDLILSSASFDIANMFGYGDIEGWITELLTSGIGERFKMEFYKRQTLVEKALSIVEKRNGG